MNNCIICHEPFEQWMIDLNHKYHENCQNCHYCGHVVGSSVIDKILKDEKDTPNGEIEHTEKIIIYHQPCRDRALEADFKNKPVIITQEHLDLLNRSHLFMQQLMTGNPDVSIETNQDITDKMTIPWFKDLDMDQKFFFLKQVEAVCTRLNIALDKDKDRARTRAQQRDLTKFKEVVDYREGQADVKKQARMKSLTEIEISNEKANPMLKARRKAVEAFTKMGISLADAEKMVDGANKPN